MLDCCEKCKKYVNCERKWILGERGIKSYCCMECEKYNICVAKNTLERWKIIHGKVTNEEKHNNSFSVSY